MTRLTDKGVQDTGVLKKPCAKFLMEKLSNPPPVAACTEPQADTDQLYFTVTAAHSTLHRLRERGSLLS